MQNRLLIVSNRLPLVPCLENDHVCLQSAGGGLANGLRPYHEKADGLWIGWPGDLSQFSADQRADLERQFCDRAIVPVALSRDHIDRYYHGFANRVLWQPSAQACTSCSTTWGDDPANEFVGEVFQRQVSQRQADNCYLPAPNCGRITRLEALYSSTPGTIRSPR